VWFSVVLLMAHAELWRLRKEPPEEHLRVGATSSALCLSLSSPFWQIGYGGHDPCHGCPSVSGRRRVV
jgi:hypothetical protein